ncbi:hypothetical protein [Clostridium pasteurianum]|uniref:Uncharacterized protein n=1 Tax=Clostridium pasteurianum BC1 TaxID=86416 RepID=R4KAY6_CLOPA|nr:hypothetical protein [Clostridium pasteurianum]AGK96800.1 hypothetical protein Clopa_1900 [Clostridium pasteurianum BC1]
MLATTTVGVLIPIFTVNANGQKLPNFHPNTPDRTFKGNFQPYRYNVQDKPYGITDSTSNWLFCKDFNLDASMHLLINGSQYKIDSISAYTKHVELFLSKVVGI